MDKNQLKKNAALAALDYVKNGMIVGVGTGSTVDYFIEALAGIKGRIEAAVASSVATEKRLKMFGIPMIDLNSAALVDIYVDGADEVDPHLNLIKGGGGALTREKIVASCARQFICIVDQTKKVEILGDKFPVPIEVLPMARSMVARKIIQLGGNPAYRENFVTDNGNIILDIHQLKLLDPIKWETELKTIVGVVENGIFAKRKPEKVILAAETGVTTL